MNKAVIKEGFSANSNDTSKVVLLMLFLNLITNKSKIIGLHLEWALTQ